MQSAFSAAVEMIGSNWGMIFLPEATAVVAALTYRIYVRGTRQGEGAREYFRWSGHLYTASTGIYFGSLAVGTSVIYDNISTVPAALQYFLQSSWLWTLGFIGLMALCYVFTKKLRGVGVYEILVPNLLGLAIMAIASSFYIFVLERMNTYG